MKTLYYTTFILFITLFSGVSPLFSQQKTSNPKEIYKKCYAAFENKEMDEAYRLSCQLEKELDLSSKDTKEFFASFAHYSAFKFYIEKDYIRAMEWGEKAMSTQVECDPKDYKTINDLITCLILYCKEIDKKEALKLEILQLDYIRKVFPEDYPELFSSLNSIATSYYVDKDYIKAIETTAELLNLQKKHIPDDIKAIVKSLTDLSKYNSHAKNKDEAFRYIEEAINIQKNKPLSSQESLLNALKPMWQSFNLSVSDHSRWLGLIDKTYQLQRGNMPAEELEKLKRLEKFSSFYWYLHLYPQAIDIKKEEITILQKQLPQTRLEYLKALGELAYYLSLHKENRQSIETYQHIIPLLSDDIEKEFEQKLKYLKSLTRLFTGQDNYPLAIETLQSTLMLLKKKYPSRINDINSIQHDIAWCYNRIGNKAKYLSISKEVFQFSLLHAADVKERLKAYQDMAWVYEVTNESDAELQTLGEAREILRKEKVADNNAIRGIMYNLIRVYMREKEYPKALEANREYTEMITPLVGKEHSSLVNLLIEKAQILFDMGNKQEAQVIAKQVINIVDNDPDSFRFSKANLYRSAYKILGDYQSMIAFMEKEINEKIEKGTLPYELQLSYSTLALEYDFTLKNLAKAIEYKKKALDAELTYIGDNYSIGFGSLGGFWLKAGNMDESLKYYKEATRRLYKTVLHNFSGMTVKDRESFWENNKYILQYMPLYAMEAGFHPGFTCEAYNAILFSKGLLLNSEIELNNLISEIGDPRIIKLFGELREVRKNIDAQYALPVDKREENVSALEEKANDIERRLMKESKEFGDYTRNLTVKWEDIRKSLGKQDIAMEFVDFPIKADSIMYGVLMLRQEWESPKMVMLFDNKQLDSIQVGRTVFAEAIKEDIAYNKDLIYSCEELTGLIWGNIKEYIQPGDNIYFAPTGVLHQLAIEYLPDEEGQLMCELFNLHRLSSTRQLVINKTKNEEQKAVVYGGIQYQVAPEALADVNRSYHLRRDLVLTASRENAGSIFGKSVSASYLPATKDEAIDIDKKLSGAKWKTNLYMDKYGTEESLKALSGSHTGLLHIATHGFFLGTNNTETNNNNTNTREVQQTDNTDSKSLNRSGLLMSGANNALLGNLPPEGADDGILTAKEISYLDFRNMELVVLSACQTGLGEVTGEGVFGLQRGFKKAGAETLVMSLWKVDDVATKIMMTSFYDNIAQGKPKRDAFMQALQYLRGYSYEYDEEVEDYNTGQKATVKKRVRFDHPQYWAAFIMLD